VDIGHTVDPPGSRGVRLLFEPEDEVRARQDRFERGPKAAFETTWPSPTRSAPGRALLVERHQAIDLAGRQRAPVPFAGEPREDLSRARLLLAGRRRPAGEDLLAARRLRDARRLVRSLDDQILEVRQRRDAGAAGTAARERPIVRTNQVLVRAIEAPDERGGHALLTRADEDRLGPNEPGPASGRTARGAALVLPQR